MANIIIQRGNNYGKTRSEQEENLRKDWDGSMSEEKLDKLKFLERKQKEKYGLPKQFTSQVDIDEFFRNDKR